MKICVAQIGPIKGEIDKNIEIHKKFIDLAISKEADIIFFPELSLTGYEPKLAKNLATTQNDKRFDDFQNISDSHKITIGVGMPTKIDSDILISTIIFQPHEFRHYPDIAKKYSMTVLMSNCLGTCDDFESAGKSAIWNKDGLLVGQLNKTAEGILIYDTGAEKIIK